MDLTHWDRLETLFLDALAREPDERTAWLRHACGADAALYHEVAGLLDADAHPAAILDDGALDALGATSLGDLLDGDLLGGGPGGELPERVGPWRVAERIGEGGMGTVFRAERADAGFEQTVALKLVKRGMDSVGMLARFRAERRILGRLEHPGIARLVDGGRAGAEAGAGYADRPYFAMEFVDGEPITDYCDAHRLGVDARLALIEAACQAVAYAHENLVVHRDLKPSNLLVADTPDGPRVKLLDFGIAKLLADDDGDGGDGGLTQTGQRPFTPTYAAPEQLRGDAVTTATDVYGLGAVLYRVLTGWRPVESAGRSPAELELAVLTELPARPSAVVRGDAGAAEARGTTPERLARRLSGDLDRIVLKALAKDAADRYPTARDLLADLRRHRQGLPVEARAGSRGYVVRRFARRHRTGLTATAAALAGIALVATFAFARVTSERDRAAAEATKAAEVSGFLTSMLEAADPSLAQGDTLSAFDILDAGTARIDAELAGQPEVQAEMLLLVGRVHDKLGQPTVGVPLLRRSLQIRRALFGDAHPDVAEVEVRLARVLRSLDEIAEAEALYRRALATQLGRLGAGSPAAARTKRHLASLLRDKGEYAEAEVLYRTAIATFAAADPPDLPGQLDAMNSLAILLEIQGRLPEATTTLRDVLEVEHATAASDIDVAQTYKTLGMVLREQGEDEEAENATRRALEIEVRILGPDHLYTSTSYRNLASILRDQGRYGEAAELYERALAIRRRVLGPDHRRVGNLLDSYAKLYRETGDLDRAIELQREVLRIQSVQPSPSPNRVAGARHNLATLHLLAGRRAEAERGFRVALRVLAASMPDDSPEHVSTLMSLGEALTAWGRADEGAPLLRRAVELARAGFEPDSPETAKAERRYADALVASGRADDARAVLTASLARLRTAGADAGLVEAARERLGRLPRA